MHYAILPLSESQTLTNGCNDTTTKGMASSATPTASNAAQYTSDSVCMPVRNEVLKAKHHQREKVESASVCNMPYSYTMQHIANSAACDMFCMDQQTSHNNILYIHWNQLLICMTTLTSI